MADGRKNNGGWRPGSGRKKGFASEAAQRFRNDLAKVLMGPLGEKIIKRTIEQAETGDKDARNFLYDRSFGKPKQELDINDDHAREELDELRGQIKSLMPEKKSK